MTDHIPTIALVSGANRGIGRAIVAGLADSGIEVLLGARDLARGEAVAAEISAAGAKVRAVQLDTTDDESVAALAQFIKKDYGRLDILINNAGIGLDYVPGLSIMERLAQTFSVNVEGTVRLTEAMIPLLEQSKRARVVNVSSELGSFGFRADSEWPYAEFAMPTYQASKAAVNSLTVSYARQLAEKNIKVNCVCPGYTATESTNFMGPRTPEQAAQISIQFARLDDEGPSGVFVNDAGEIPW